MPGAVLAVHMALIFLPLAVMVAAAQAAKKMVVLLQQLLALQTQVEVAVAVELRLLRTQWLARQAAQVSSSSATLAHSVAQVEP